MASRVSVGVCGNVTGSNCVISGAGNCSVVVYQDNKNSGWPLSKWGAISGAVDKAQDELQDQLNNEFADVLWTQVHCSSRMVPGTDTLHVTMTFRYQDKPSPGTSESGK